MRLTVAVRGTEPPARDPSTGKPAQLPAGPALRSRGPGTHPDLANLREWPQAIDVPVQCLGAAQVPGQPSRKVPLRRTHVDVPPRREAAISSAGHRDPARARKAQDEAIDPSGSTRLGVAGFARRVHDERQCGVG